jgi:hypothetical protein
VLSGQSLKRQKMDRDRELRWLLALQAALFFSVPSWMLTVEYAWPGDSTYQFALAVILGASTALVLCHVVPATCAGTLSALFENSVGRIILWPVGAWFCVGAAASLAQTAHVSASMLLLWRDGSNQNEPARKAIAISVALVCVVVSITLAWQRTQRQRLMIALCCSEFAWPWLLSVHSCQGCEQRIRK